MKTKLFQKNIEDFVCKNCGTIVKGTGYTNHCPKCLFSKHVDTNPGDRAHYCQGLMEPIRIENKGKEYSIVHKCLSCGEERKNKVQDNDDFEEVLKIAQKQSDQN